MNFVFCKFGTKYSSDYVNKLVMDLECLVKDPVEFVCYTDVSQDLASNIRVVENLGRPTLKRVWPKLRLLSKDFPIQGKTIYLDLDTVVEKDPFQSIPKDHDWSTLHTVPAPWKRDEKYGRINSYDVTHHSSVMVWEAGSEKVDAIWNHFNSGLRDYYMRKYVGIDRFLTHENCEIKPLPLTFARSAKHQMGETFDEAVVTYEELNVRLSDLV